MEFRDAHAKDHASTFFCGRKCFNVSGYRMAGAGRVTYGRVVLQLGSCPTAQEDM